MRAVAFLLASLACVGHGHSAKMKDDLQRSQEVRDSLNALALLLQAANPTAGYRGIGYGHGAAANNPASDRAVSGTQKFANKLGAQVLAASLTGLFALSADPNVALAGPFTRTELQSLTYDQIKGTGLANSCTKVEKGGTSSIDAASVKRINDFCLEPTDWQVIDKVKKPDGTFVTVIQPSKVTSKQTYVLTGIEGKLEKVDGAITFTEQDGIDYAATTVQLQGGERVPFLFTVKNLVAKASDNSDKIAPGLKLSGSFRVPSYRTGLFLDPKGRGITTGYDQAQALPGIQATNDETLFKENNKKFDVGKGSIELEVTSVNKEANEIGGVFVQKQPSDTDLGAKEPKEILMKGNWFATVE